MRRKQLILMTVSVIFCASLFISGLALASSGGKVNLVVSSGNVLVTNFQGKTSLYTKNEGNVLLSPQSIVIPQKGTCVVKSEKYQFIVDAGDILSFESEKDMSFSCLGGTIQVIGEEETYLLNKSEQIITTAATIQRNTLPAAVQTARNDTIEEVLVRSKNIGFTGSTYGAPYEVEVDGPMVNTPQDSTGNDMEVVPVGVIVDYASPYQ